MITLEGTLEKIRFASEDGAFAVATVEEKTGREVTVIGNLLETKPGESVVMQGQWERNKKFGKQFRIQTIRTVPPTTTEGIKRYLSSGLVDGIGGVLAERIVDHFGPQTLEIIDADPSRIREVEGIGEKRAESIAEAWTGQRVIRDVMVFLQSHGVSPAYALRIYKKYEHQTIAVVQENPYRLADEVWGIGFKKADGIALGMGIEKDSVERIRAGLRYTLVEAQGDGHVYLPLDVLKKRASEILGLGEDLLGDGLRDLRESGAIVVEPLEDEQIAIYREKMWRTEVDSAKKLSAIIKAQRRFQPGGVAHKVEAIEASLGIELASQQRRAVEAAWQEKVCVITGGPGTGKTTIVRTICELADQLGQSVALAAPTGRAAKRLSESTQRTAKTVHRLLEYNPHEGGFQVNEQNPLDVSVLIIDEASMIDIELLAAIVDALPVDAALVFVGDIDQLPSVGPGSVLEDIIESESVEVVMLTEIFRQAAESAIVTNAHRINQGLAPVDPPRVEGKLTDFYTIAVEDPTTARERILQLVTERIPDAFGFDPIEEVQVLSPMHRGEVGCSRLNEEMQASFNDGAPEYVRGKTLWRVGDKVMQTRNNYEEGVFNGDIGRIERIDKFNKKLYVGFEENSVGYEFKDLDELKLAYAITVHKSQGSEYPCVVLPILTQHYVMLQRNLLYTAVTRAKSLVVMVGSQKAVDIAVKNAGANRRYTRLSERLLV